MVYYGEIDFKNPAGSKYYGGLVYSFVSANGVLDAIEKFNSAINEKKLEVIDFTFVALYEDIPWETQDSQKHFDSLAKEASNKHEVIFDSFDQYQQP